MAYVSEQNLLDDSGHPVNHPQVDELFSGFDGDGYTLHPQQFH